MARSAAQLWIGRFIELAAKVRFIVGQQQKQQRQPPKLYCCLRVRVCLCGRAVCDVASGLALQCLLAVAQASAFRCIRNCKPAVRTAHRSLVIWHRMRRAAFVAAFYECVARQRQKKQQQRRRCDGVGCDSTTRSESNACVAASSGSSSSAAPAHSHYTG